MPGSPKNVGLTLEIGVFVKCKPSGSTQRSTVLPERAGVDADVKAGALRRPVKLPPGCPALVTNRDSERRIERRIAGVLAL